MTNITTEMKENVSAIEIQKSFNVIVTNDV